MLARTASTPSHDFNPVTPLVSIGSFPDQFAKRICHGCTVEEIAIAAVYCIHLNLFKRKLMANSRENQLKAEAQFHKTLKKAQEAKQAMSQYEADARAVDEKTAKLRALRLAKEASEAKEAAEKNTKIKKRAVSKKAAGTSPEEET
jgi:hypothetical protein